jgi:predicted phosphoribosyltransferase
MRPVSLFFDRRDAGRRLARRLFTEYGHRSDVVVMALARGGMPVGDELASRLGCELGMVVTRKVGLPFNPRLAMGAVASGGVEVFNDDIIESMRIDPRQLEKATAREHSHLRRTEKSLRYGYGRAPLRDRTAILVDDGMATGASMRAAIQAVRSARPKDIIVATPIGTPAVCEKVAGEADGLFCVGEVLEIYAVGQAYRSYRAVSDDEVRYILGTTTGLTVPSRAH